MASDEQEDPKVKALRQRMQGEHEAIISGVGLVTRVWATLESSLFELFRLLANFAGPSATCRVTTEACLVDAQWLKRGCVRGLDELGSPDQHQLDGGPQALPLPCRAARPHSESAPRPAAHFTFQHC